MPKMNRASERGFTLLEMVCVLALIAMLAAVLLPFMPRHTSRSRLQAYVLQTAALLKEDRNAAIRRGTGVATLVDAGSRVIRSGATPAVVRIPDDVQFRGAAAPHLQPARGAVDDQLLCQRNVVRRSRCPDAGGCRLRGSRQLADRKD